MKAARAFVFVAICMCVSQADATCHGWGSPGYGALVSDCHFADSLWAGYCSGGPAVPASDCCNQGCGYFTWYGANAGCNTCCDPCGGCGGGEWMAKLRGHFESMKARMSHGSCNDHCGSCCDTGCGGGGGCGWGGSGMFGGGCGCGKTSCDPCDTCCDPCDTCCDSGCGGGMNCNWLHKLRARLGHGVCQQRYQPLSPCECMCENARCCGSRRGWLGGGCLDNCGMVGAFPAQGIDYSYLNYCCGGARTPATTHAQPTAAQPANQSVEGSTVNDNSNSIYDETNSFQSDMIDGSQGSELVPPGTEANGE